jgi:hypothetical protein
VGVLCQECELRESVDQTRRREPETRSVILKKKRKAAGAIGVRGVIVSLGCRAAWSSGRGRGLRASTVTVSSGGRSSGCRVQYVL